MSGSSSLLVVGGGITGLCIAVAAQARGFAVTVISRDAIGDTASGVAAGMIAPALEALGEPEPDVSYARLKRAQQAWLDLIDVWPVSLREAIVQQTEARSRYVWAQSDNSSDITTPRLKSMGVPFSALDDAQLADIAADMDGVEISGDWLIGAASALKELQAQFEAAGGTCVRGTVTTVAAESVGLETGQSLSADHIVVAAGYGSKAFSSLAGMAHVSPVKGHLIDLKGQGGHGVTRSSGGYLADYGASAKFGATMQFGLDDLTVEPAVVDDLKARALSTLPHIDLTEIAPRTGVRATTPDSWPLIGRDKGTDVYVATGMRRNGFIFAPYAAQIVLALITGEPVPEDAGLYRPDRF